MGTVHTAAVHFRYDRYMRRLVNDFSKPEPHRSYTQFAKVDIALTRRQSEHTVFARTPWSQPPLWNLRSGGNDGDRGARPPADRPAPRHDSIYAWHLKWPTPCGGRVSLNWARSAPVACHNPLPQLAWYSTRRSADYCARIPCNLCNNNNNNNQIYIAPYGRNFRGAGGWSDQCSCSKSLTEHKSFRPKSGLKNRESPMRAVCGSEFQTDSAENWNARLEKSVLVNSWSSKKWHGKKAFGYVTLTLHSDHCAIRLLPPFECEVQGSRSFQGLLQVATVSRSFAS